MSAKTSLILIFGAIVSFGAWARTVEYTKDLTSTELADALADDPTIDEVVLRGNNYRFNGEPVVINRAITIRTEKSTITKSIHGWEELGGFFKVVSGGKLTLKNLTLQVGWWNPSPIVVEAGGELVATDCEFLDNKSDAGTGGAVLAEGNATFTRCLFGGNVARRASPAADAYGAAIYARNCNLIIDSCSFVSNSFTMTSASYQNRGHGSAVYYSNTHSANEGKAVIVNSTISDNRANAICCGGYGRMAVVQSVVVGTTVDANNSSPAVVSESNGKIYLLGSAIAANSCGNTGNSGIESEWTTTTTSSMIHTHALPRNPNKISTFADFYVCAAHEGCARRNGFVWRDTRWNRFGFGPDKDHVSQVFSIDGTSSGVMDQCIDKDIRGNNRRADFNSIGSTQTEYITITFKPNGGVGEEKVINSWEAPFSTVDLDHAPVFTRAGFAMNGWSTSDSVTEGYTGVRSISEIVGGDAVPSKVDLYVAWSPLTYYVEYNLNGGTGTVPASEVRSYSQNKNVADGTGFSRSGYRFLGWNTKADGTGDAYLPGEMCSRMTSVANATVRLYARWGDFSEPVAKNGKELDQLINHQAIRPTDIHVNSADPVTIELDEEIHVQTGFSLVNDNSANTVEISAGGHHRHFLVDSGARLTLKGVTLKDGKSENADGGSILNQGELDLTYCNFIGNQAIRQDESSVAGGAICNSGYCFVQYSRFATNRVSTGSVSGYACGAALYNVGTAVVDRVTMTAGELSSNKGYDYGGAVYSAGASSSLVIANSTIHGNKNAINIRDGVAAIVQSTITSNTGTLPALVTSGSPNTAVIGSVIVGNAVNADWSANQIRALRTAGVGELNIYGSMYGNITGDVIQNEDTDHGINFQDGEWKKSKFFLVGNMVSSNVLYKVQEDFVVPLPKARLLHAVRTRAVTSPIVNPFVEIGFGGDSDIGEDPDTEMTVFPRVMVSRGIIESEGLTSVNWSDILRLSRRSGITDVREVFWAPGSRTILPYIHQVQLADALDLPSSMQMGSVNGWIGQSETSFDGKSSAQSMVTRNGDVSSFVVKATGPGVVSFRWKISCDNQSDNLRFFVDGVRVAAVTGETDWRECSYAIDEGTYTLMWEYAKDGSERVGKDCAWVDALSLYPRESGKYIINWITEDDWYGGFGECAVRYYESDRVYNLVPPQEFTPRYGYHLNGWNIPYVRRYDDGVLFFNLANPGEKVDMAPVWID